MDAGGRAMLEEDLRSPCTEEIAVFRALRPSRGPRKRWIRCPRYRPRQGTPYCCWMQPRLTIGRSCVTQGDMPESVRQLLPRLRDKDYTHVLIVTLPEATPVHEAERLQGDLIRAGITPRASVISRSPYPGQRHARPAPRSSAVGTRSLLFAGWLMTCRSVGPDSRGWQRHRTGQAGLKQDYPFVTRACSEFLGDEMHH